jgi:hypothetical protein
VGSQTDFLGKRHKWHWVGWQTNLTNFPKFNVPPFNSLSPIQSSRQQIRIIMVCSCVKMQRHDLPIKPGDVMTLAVFL